MVFTGKKIFLAPLAGISDTIFRTICKEYGADVVISEMISAEGIFYNSKATKELLYFKETERPFGIQIFGANPLKMAKAAEYIQRAVNPDFIDINSGCPVPKVVKKNGGAALLKDINLFKNIVSCVVKACSVPVSVKIRSGWFENQWVDIEFANCAADCGVCAVILHPRSKTMGFSGHSYWERIALVKNSVKIPVIGNGDIFTAQDAQKMLSLTQCDSIMIGRGALGNPWIFSQIKAILSDKISPIIPSFEDKIILAIKHTKNYEDFYGSKKAVSHMKKHIAWYLHGIPNVSAFRSQIFNSKSITEINDILLKLLNNILPKKRYY
jgi:tRNA-dihydrouridine synthase B